jgi:hypothetical protein
VPSVDHNAGPWDSRQGYEAVSIAGAWSLSNKYALSTHDIGGSAKYLRQAAHYDVSIGQYFDVDEIADRFVNNDQEIVFIRKGAKSG